MRKAILYRELSSNRVQCTLCYRSCIILPGERGYCQSRINLDGELYSLIYGIVSVFEPTPIEDKPFIRFRPGTVCLSVGTYGCNFRCPGCQNHELSWGTRELDALADWARSLPAEHRDQVLPAEVGLTVMMPEEIVQEALDMGCEGIAFTFNEPTIWLEYVLDVARLAHEHRLYTVYVTNSYLSPEHLNVLGPHLDAMALDIKSLDDGYYTEYCDVASAAQNVLRSCLQAASNGIHVETRTCIVPGANDDPEMLDGIATWIRDNLGEDSVWHVLRFFPKHRLAHLSPTPMETLQAGVEIGRRAGLEYVNLVADKGCD